MKNKHVKEFGGSHLGADVGQISKPVHTDLRITGSLKTHKPGSIPVGLGILATEFAWAYRMLTIVRERIQSAIINCNSSNKQNYKEDDYMNLNSVADINSIVEYVNNHTEKKLKPELFYNKKL